MAEPEELFMPHMPVVDIRQDIELIFSRARAAADESTQDAEGFYRRQVIIVTPGRLLVSKECPLPSEIPNEEIMKLSSLVPPVPPRNIAVIAYTLLDALKSDILKAIPFFGYLLGFAAIGHKVWVFEGDKSALAAGCWEADILLIDGGILPELDATYNWREVALNVMQGNEIKLISRGSG